MAQHGSRASGGRAASLDFSTCSGRRCLAACGSGNGARVRACFGSQRSSPLLEPEFVLNTQLEHIQSAWALQPIKGRAVRTRSVWVHDDAILGARKPLARTCARTLPAAAGSESRSSITCTMVVASQSAMLCARRLWYASSRLVRFAARFNGARKPRCFVRMQSARKS